MGGLLNHDSLGETFGRAFKKSREILVSGSHFLNPGQHSSLKNKNMSIWGNQTISYCLGYRCTRAVTSDAILDFGSRSRDADQQAKPTRVSGRTENKVNKAKKQLANARSKSSEFSQQMSTQPRPT